MQHGKAQLAKTARLIRKNQSETLELSERLHGILHNLHYEGKLFLGKNLKEIERALEFINHEIVWRADLEDNVIFPFMAEEIPWLESMIHLLKSEHDDLRRHFRLIEKLLKQVSREKQADRRRALVKEIRESGIYLVHLLRTHIEVEDKNIYRLIDEELYKGSKRVNA